MPYQGVRFRVMPYPGIRFRVGRTCWGGFRFCSGLGLGKGRGLETVGKGQRVKSVLMKGFNIWLITVCIRTWPSPISQSLRTLVL